MYANRNCIFMFCIFGTCSFDVCVFCISGNCTFGFIVIPEVAILYCFCSLPLLYEGGRNGVHTLGGVYSTGDSVQGQLNSQLPGNWFLSGVYLRCAQELFSLQLTRRQKSDTQIIFNQNPPLYHLTVQVSNCTVQLYRCTVSVY